MTTPGPARDQMASDDDRLYDEGWDHFDNQRFYEAHEAWEAIWLRSEGHIKDRLQILILVAVGMHHATHENMKGARRTLQRAKKRLANLEVHAAPDDHGSEDRVRRGLQRDNLKQHVASLAQLAE